MRKYPLALAAFAALGLGACGPEEIAPPPKNDIDPESHFAVSLCTCFEYEAADDRTQKLGISIEAVTDTYSPGEPGHLIRFRKNSGIFREEVWYPTQNALELGFARRMDENPEVAGWFAPRLPLVPVGTEPVKISSLFQVGEEETPVEFEASVIPNTVKFSVDGTEPTAQPATQIHYEGMPWQEGDRYFVPEVGIVEISMRDSTGTRQKFQLRNKRVLEGGCGQTDSIQPVADACGFQR